MSAYFKHPRISDIAASAVVFQRISDRPILQIARYFVLSHISGAFLEKARIGCGAASPSGNARRQRRRMLDCHASAVIWGGGRLFQHPFESKSTKGLISLGGLFRNQQQPC